MASPKRIFLLIVSGVINRAAWSFRSASLHGSRSLLKDRQFPCAQRHQLHSLENNKRTHLLAHLDGEETQHEQQHQDQEMSSELSEYLLDGASDSFRVSIQKPDQIVQQMSYAGYSSYDFDYDYDFDPNAAANNAAATQQQQPATRFNMNDPNAKDSNPIAWILAFGAVFGYFSWRQWRQFQKDGVGYISGYGKYMKDYFGDMEGLATYHQNTVKKPQFWFGRQKMALFNSFMLGALDKDLSGSLIKSVKYTAFVLFELEPAVLVDEIMFVAKYLNPRRDFDKICTCFFLIERLVKPKDYENNENFMLQLVKTAKSFKMSSPEMLKKIRDTTQNQVEFNFLSQVRQIFDKRVQAIYSRNPELAGSLQLKLSATDDTIARDAEELEMSGRFDDAKLRRRVDEDLEKLQRVLANQLEKDITDLVGTGGMANSGIEYEIFGISDAQAMAIIKEGVKNLIITPPMPVGNYRRYVETAGTSGGGSGGSSRAGGSRGGSGSYSSYSGSASSGSNSFKSKSLFKEMLAEEELNKNKAALEGEEAEKPLEEEIDLGGWDPAAWEASEQGNDGFQNPFNRLQGGSGSGKGGSKALDNRPMTPEEKLKAKLAETGDDYDEGSGGANPRGHHFEEDDDGADKPLKTIGGGPAGGGLDSGSGSANTYECTGCGFTLFVAKGRDHKFFGTGFKCPECGAGKDKFESV